MNETYSKWDEPEHTDYAYARVKNGEWNINRFEEWVYQVRLVEYRDATEDESI